MTTHWKTKAGQIIAIKDMTDLHLTNTINMLRRKMNAKVRKELDKWDSAYSAAASLSGDMASYYADQQLDEMWTLVQSPPSQDEVSHEALVEEANRRGLKV